VDRTRIEDLIAWIPDGLDPKSISIAGRGWLDPRVKTADNVPEPLNRRVEITVR
jgi:flagellar motor protein MotB